MLRLLATLLLLNSFLFATQSKLIEEFLTEKFQENKAIKKLSVKVVDVVDIDDMPKWKAFIVLVDADLETNKSKRKIKQKMIWFSDGNVITKEFTDLITGDSLRDRVSPTLKAKHYKKENLISGDENSKHKVAIFSDPLCPFCRSFVPKAIKEMKKQPEKFAVYYYNFPLPTIHPASMELCQAEIAAKLKGRKNSVVDMYKIKIDPDERDIKKILSVFNKVMKTDITPQDLKSQKVQEFYKNDLQIADDVMVQGTPTIFFDGKIDKTKKKYQKVK
jgi:protein-disulfide isomerase